MYFAVAVLAFVLPAIAQSATIRVDPTSTTDGYSVTLNGAGVEFGGLEPDWSDAYHDLQQAIADAVEKFSGADVIVVAHGMYVPHPSDRTVSFVLHDGLELKGNYAGFGAADPGLRDPVEFETILSGDLAGDDSANAPFSASLTDDNSYHVLRAESVGATAKLDGFTIVGGNAVNHAGSATECASQQEIPNASGGGLFCRAASPTIRDCVFKGNHALVGGAIGMYCSSAPNIVNCRFESNLAYDGQGIDSITCGTTPTGLDNSGNGGGIHMRFANSPRIDNCVFACNLAGHVGGGVSIQHGNNSPDFTNCVFVGNVSGCEGGGVRSGMYSGAHLVNCTFVGNVSSQGGGFSMSPLEDPPSTDPRDTRLVNCILWGNAANAVSDCTASQDPVGGAQISVTKETGTHKVDIERCDVQGCSATGTANVYDRYGEIVWVDNLKIDVTPGFVDPSDPDGADNRFATSDDGLRLSFTSPCLNEGNAELLPADDADVNGNATIEDHVPWDVASEARQVNAADCVDLGAYENQSDTCAGDLGGGSGGAPDGVVDAADLGILLGRWGTVGGLADLAPACGTGDGTVGSADLAVLLGAWGACPSGNSAMSGNAAMASGALTPSEVAEQMGFANLDEFVEWLVELGPQAMAAWLQAIFGG